MWHHFLLSPSVSLFTEQYLVFQEFFKEKTRTLVLTEVNPINRHMLLPYVPAEELNKILLNIPLGCETFSFVFLSRRDQLRNKKKKGATIQIVHKQKKGVY
jgi:hypothetical protein